MSRPSLWFQWECQPGVNNTLSYHPPYNKATIKFSCNQQFKKFLCRCTLESEPWGRDLGYLVQEYTGVHPAETQINFEIDATTAMTKGDGLYRIALYVQNTDGEWNYGEYFLVKGGGYFLESGVNKVIVKTDDVPPLPAIKFSSEDGDFTLSTSNSSKSWNGTLYYSTDKTNWLEWTGTSAISSNNNVLYIRGKNNIVITSSPSHWVLTGTNIKCEGNIETLLDWEVVKAGNHPPMTNYCYQFMFSGCTALIAAPELPATTLTDCCYQYMFNGCTSLTTAPELPATTLTSSCYADMFHGCTSLTTAPELPATTLYSSCYADMFWGCTSLTTAPSLPATTLKGACYFSMFRNCTSLTTAPSLPATTLANECYYCMFHGCTSLTTAPSLPATTLANECYEGIFYGCTSLYVSDTQTAEATKVWRIPSSEVFSGKTYAQSSIFRECKGTRLSDDLPGEIGQSYTYYTQNEPV